MGYVDMKRKLLAIVTFYLLMQGAYAQTLKGTVTEVGGKTKLADVFVKNTNNKQISLTDKNGRFDIPAQTGNLLIFSSPGYVSDTLYVTDLRPKQVQLTLQSIALREVSIRSSNRFDPRTEYPEVYERSKVYVFSPSSWMSRDARNARRLKHYFAREAQERSVDSAFSRAYVGSIVPLKGQQLDDFMTLYRPSYAFLKSNNGASMAVYINDSYKKYMALPPEKRRVQPLTP